MKSRLSFFSLQIIRFAIVALLMFLITLIYRVCFILYYANFSELKSYFGDLLFSFMQGGRFDILVILYFLIPLLVFAILASLFYINKNNKSILTRVRYKLCLLFTALSKIWAIFAAIFYLSLLIGDFYYYSFFRAHYNMLAFGIFDDETQSVLKSIWLDFPVIRIILVFIVLSILIYLVIGKIYTSHRLKHFANNKITRYSFIAILLLSIFFIRGRLGTFPLRMEDAYFSKNQFINTLTLNGIFSLKDAYVDYKRNQFDITVNDVLNESGFSSDKELVAIYMDILVDSIINDPFYYLKRKTNTNQLLVDNPPHVIVLQMEGMGLNLMNLQNEEFQILGSLASELSYCIVYKKFLPFFENTINSLEGLLTSCVNAPVSLTSHYNKQNLASAIIPFKDAGYTSTFITGAKKAWRNLNVYLPAQGFDYYESKENIKAEIPDAIEAEWGIYDGYMFEQIWNRLKNASSPQFIFGMTITNHTPYVIPPNYSVSNINISEELKKHLLQSESACFECFSTYRYACDCLANLIKRVRESHLSDNTIIAITGDHSIKGILQTSDNDLLSAYGVPLILYVPDKYLEDKIIDTNVWGSHKDIFPTLFNLALSDAYYYNLGNDLLSKSALNNFAIDIAIASMDNTGAISSSNQWYKWQDETTVLLPVEKDSSLVDLQHKVKVWKSISKYILARTINETN